MNDNFFQTNFPKTKTAGLVVLLIISLTIPLYKIIIVKFMRMGKYWSKSKCLLTIIIGGCLQGDVHNITVQTQLCSKPLTI